MPKSSVYWWMVGQLHARACSWPTTSCDHADVEALDIMSCLGCMLPRRLSRERQYWRSRLRRRSNTHNINGTRDRVHQHQHDHNSSVGDSCRRQLPNSLDMPKSSVYWWMVGQLHARACSWPTTSCDHADVEALDLVSCLGCMLPRRLSRERSIGAHDSGAEATHTT